MIALATDLAHWLLISISRSVRPVSSFLPPICAMAERNWRYDSMRFCGRCRRLRRTGIKVQRDQPAVVGPAPGRLAAIAHIVAQIAQTLVDQFQGQADGGGGAKQRQGDQPFADVSVGVNPPVFAGEAAFWPARSAVADEGCEAGRARSGALLISATTMLSSSASLAGQNGASVSNSGVGPSVTSWSRQACCTCVP